MTSRLHHLSALGQSVWIDFLSRELLESGALARTVAGDAVVGVTVHEAARIMGKAAAGEILVSEATRALAQPSGFAFDDSARTRSGAWKGSGVSTSCSPTGVRTLASDGRGGPARWERRCGRSSGPARRRRARGGSRIPRGRAIGARRPDSQLQSVLTGAIPANRRAPDSG
jgi:hypothetical protein